MIIWLVALSSMCMVAQLQQGVWDKFIQAVEPALPRSGRVLLVYNVVDQNVFGKDVLGIDFRANGFVRLHDGYAYGTAHTGRQFAGREASGVEWDESLMRMKNAAALTTAPMALLRLLIDQPELVDTMSSTSDGGFRLEMTVIGGLPGGSESDFPSGAVVRPEAWVLEVGPDGRITKRVAPVTIQYEYMSDPWPTAYEVIVPGHKTRWELQSVNELAPDAITPAGAMRLLQSIETRHIPGPTDESPAAQGLGPVPDGYERDPARRWSFALVAGGILILVLGGGVIVRKRYAGT